MTMAMTPGTAHRVTQASTRTGYFAAHWRGELALPLSFWVNWVTVSGLLGLVLGVLTVRIDVGGQDLRSGSLAVLIGWPLMLALACWGALGAWRSASAGVARGDSRGWALAAQAGVGLGLLLTLTSTVLSFAPKVGDYLQLAQGTDPIGHLDLALSPDRRRLQLKGPVGLGDAARVKDLLAGASGTLLVEIESPGGRAGEAGGIADLLRSRHGPIRATGPCENACNAILLAGQRRQLSPPGKLGFHRAPDDGFNPLLRQVARLLQRDFYAHAGLPDGFVARVLNTAPTWTWYPERSELAAAGLVTVPERPLDVDLPVERDAAAIEYGEALRTNPVWLLIERRFPGSIPAAGERMQAARAGGADDAATQVEGQRIVEPLLTRLLVEASPEMRIQFLALLAQQLDAARALGAEACRGVLVGDAASRASLPVALAWQEASWLTDATAETDGAAVAVAEHRRPTALEAEVVRRSLGDQAPAMLARLRRPSQPGSRDGGCDRRAALIADVMHLPLAERRLAVKLAFDPEPVR